MSLSKSNPLINHNNGCYKFCDPNMVIKIDKNITCEKIEITAKTIILSAGIELRANEITFRSENPINIPDSVIINCANIVFLPSNSLSYSDDNLLYKKKISLV